MAGVCVRVLCKRALVHGFLPLQMPAVIRTCTNCLKQHKEKLRVYAAATLRATLQTDTESNKEGSKFAGDCVNRSKSWASAMRNLAANTATALKAFYRGPWACTNTWQGNGCSGNLEGTHNTWHQAIGGDVVWLAWATYDPLFW
jgi:hypothetical protein